MFTCCFRQAGCDATSGEPQTDAASPGAIPGNLSNNKIIGVGLGPEMPGVACLLEEEEGERVASAKNVDAPIVVQRFQSVNWKAHASPAAADRSNAPRAIPRRASASNSKAMSKSPIVCVQQVSSERATLLQVGMLMQKFAEAKNDKCNALLSLRSALHLVAEDCRADYISIALLSEDQEYCMDVATLGLPRQISSVQRLHATSDPSTAHHHLVKSDQMFMSWQASTGRPIPLDWLQLHVHGGLQYLSAVRVKCGNKRLGILTVGFTDSTKDRGDSSMWPTYCQLVAAAISNVLKGTRMLEVVAMLRSLQHISSLDEMVRRTLKGLKVALGCATDKQLWFRIALIANTNRAATIFDDTLQLPAHLLADRHPDAWMLGTHGSITSEGSSEVASGNLCVMRTGVAMQSTIMQVAASKNSQVTVPDLQRTMNQGGTAFTDIFHTSVMTPPTSVMVIPLHQEAHVFGVLYAMSSTKTNFDGISGRLCQICHIIGPHLFSLLCSNAAEEYQEVQDLYLPEGNADASCAAPLTGFDEALLACNDSSDACLSARRTTMPYTGRSSIGSLVMGLTEKLNQNRGRSSISIDRSSGDVQVDALADLELVERLGEGGFGTVFKGSWMGLVVAVKVVSDYGGDNRMILRSAHEIAILTRLSHPNIVQGYRCLADVQLMALEDFCARNLPKPLLGATSNGSAGPGKTCHVQIMEFCDMGTLASALKGDTFLLHPSQPGAPAGPPTYSVQELRQRVERVNLKAVVVTLIEVASALAYLHKMGVVHCDVKPANILLRSNLCDQRGFGAMVADFGLSRVEDYEEGGLFPCNSCGTVQYLAPEALGDTRHVNSSVDVYAFGILMWELLTGCPPYMLLSHNDILEEVRQGLRPQFPRNTPTEYADLGRACWGADPLTRPTFNQVLQGLKDILRGCGGTAQPAPRVEPLSKPAGVPKGTTQPLDKKLV